MIEQKLNQLQIDDPEANSNIEERYNAWISNISKENKFVFEKIFCDIKYYSERELRKRLQELFSSINTTEDFLDDTLILFIESQSSKYNSSFFITGFLVQANNIAKNFCTLEEYKAKKYNPSNIVLCDDFIGTGKTIIDYITKNFDILKDKVIYLLCIHCMNDGKINLLQYAKDNGLNLTLQSFAISDKYLTNSNKEMLEPYLVECKKLKLNNALGYRKSEANIVTYNNTPNNTLSVIWEESSVNKAVFPRKEVKTPEWRKMNQEKKERRIERYINGEKD